DVLVRTNHTQAKFPITARVPANECRVRMSCSEFREVHWRGFTRKITSDFEPRMLKHDRLEFGRPFDEWIQFRRVAVLRDPKLHSNHRPGADAAVEFIKTGLGVFWIKIDETKGAVRKSADRPKHLVV